MAQLSKRMEAAADDDRVLPRAQLLRSVTGRPETVARALEALVESGHVVVAPGRAAVCVLVRPFRVGDAIAAVPVVSPAEVRGPRLVSRRAYVEHVRAARRLLLRLEEDPVTLGDMDRVVAVAGAHALLGLAVAVAALAESGKGGRRG